jgi:ABC-2 type transport system ATP-binding protein
MIEIRELTKTFGSAGIRDVSFSCEPGTVTGFLGPNGAGKSTTMRLLCGLMAADAGSATIDGLPYRRLPQPGRRVGVMLDPQALHAGRSGRETLGLTAALLGTGQDRVNEILRLVALDDKAAAKRVREYSLGMRQRLALGNALLGDPGILVLDEPANGLDPQGIHWMRTLLREFADRGGTVLLSSHLLHEVEAVADRLVIINEGRVVADATPADLRGARTTLVRALYPAAMAGALHAAGLTGQAGRDGSFIVEAEAEAVGRAAAQAGLVLTELRPQGADLESVFLNLTTAAADPVSTQSRVPEEVAR